MAKRFTDNEKWKDAWFMDLPSKYKLFWLYILDECNHAGVWKVNFKVASFYIGEHLEHSEVKRILKQRITILDDQYWYINKFIKYQYKCDVKDLNPKNNAHLSVIKILSEFKDFDVNYSKKDININNSEYNKDLFFYDWNELRTLHLKKPSFLNSMQSDAEYNFNSLKKRYTRDNFKEAIVGLFKQKVLPNGNTTMQSNPRHFLSHFESYLTAYHDKNMNLYGENKSEY